MAELTLEEFENYDVSKVKDLRHFIKAFHDAHPEETSWNLNNWNMRPRYSLNDLFHDCKHLEELIIDKWDTLGTASMQSMFEGCRSLKVLKQNFNTKYVADMQNMFQGCVSLTSLDLSNFNTENLWLAGGMFAFCESLTSLDISHFDMTGVSNIYFLFFGCTSLEQIKLPKFYNGSVERCSTFGHCESLTYLDFAGVGVYIRGYGFYYLYSPTDDASAFHLLCDNAEAVLSSGLKTKPSHVSWDMYEP